MTEKRNPLMESKARWEKEPGYYYGDVLPFRQKLRPDGSDDPNGVPELAWPESIRALVRGGLDLLNGPNTGTVTPEGTMALLSAALPSKPGVPGNSLGTFAGTSARTADLHNLRRAQEMIAQGADPERARRLYGWVQFPDGKWRYEIPDEASVLTPPKKEMQSYSDSADTTGWSRSPAGSNVLPYSSTIPLGDLLEHPQLYNAYPELRNLPVKAVNGFDAFSGVQGSMTLDNSLMRIAGAPEDTARSTILHEIQHWIQNREGFAPGSNTGSFKTPVHKATEKSLAALQNEWRYMFKDTPLEYISPTKLQQMYQLKGREELERFEKWNPGVLDFVRQNFRPEDHVLAQNLYRTNNLAQTQAQERYAKYRTVKGEAESRLVQKRQDYTPSQRRISNPLGDFDISPALQIDAPP